MEVEDIADFIRNLLKLKVQIRCSWSCLWLPEALMQPELKPISAVLAEITDLQGSAKRLR